MKEKPPVEWPKKFGRSAELEVEIGYGLGDFPVHGQKEGTLNFACFHTPFKAHKQPG